MKYLYSTVGFVIFLIAMTTVTSFKFVTDYETYDMATNEIKSVVIDTSNINVNVSSTLDKDLKIEHIYSNSDNPESNVYYYIDGNTLNIKEYKNNTVNVLPKKETLNIYLPSETTFSKLIVSSGRGKINVDGTNIPKIHIQSDVGSVEITNLNASVLQIEGNQFATRLANLKVDQLFTHMDQSSVTIDGMIADEVNIKNNDLATVKTSKLNATSFLVNGVDTTVTMELQDNQNYVIKTNDELANKQLEKIENGYSANFVDSKTSMEIDTVGAGSLVLNITEEKQSDE